MKMKNCRVSRKIKTSERQADVRRQNGIRERADYSLALLGKAFVTNGSGSFLNIRTCNADAVLMGK